MLQCPRKAVSWIPTDYYGLHNRKHSHDCSPAAAQRRCRAASAPVFAVVRYRTQLTETRFCSSCYFLLWTLRLLLALLFLAFRSSVARALAPSPTEFVVALNINTFYSHSTTLTRGGRSSLGPGNGSVHTLGLCVPLA
eukprot:4093431-Pleurochrysis_carterae.AAC.1